MKVTPLAASTNGQATSADIGHSYSSERMARAKAIASGQDPVAVPAKDSKVDPQVERAEVNIRKIKMRTQRTVNRHGDPIVQEQLTATPEAPATQNAAATPETDLLDTSEQVQAGEDTQPLNPQAVAIAKARRAVQVERAALEAEKAELAKSKGTTPAGYTKEQIQANALGILREAGVNNEQLTEALLNEASDHGPGYSELKNEIKALKEALDQQNKSLSERDTTAETQVLTQIRKNVDQLIATGEEFETVRVAGYAPKVVELIHQTFKKTGEVLDEHEAATLLENQLIEDSVARYAQLKKVQSRIAPAQQTQAAQAGAPNTKIMRTLTNRDGSSSISMSKRERAIAAAEGRLK